MMSPSRSFTRLAKSRVPLPVVCSILVFFVSLSGVLQAQENPEPVTVSWSNASGGDFNEGENWSGGIAPRPQDTASFDLAGDYTVFFSENTDIWSVNMRPLAEATTDTTVTFDLGGKELKATSDALTEAGIIMWGRTQSDGTEIESNLRLLNGTVDIKVLRVGQSDDPAAKLFVDGGATLIARDNNRVGNSGTGELHIVSGGKAQLHSTLELGYYRSGVLRVSGLGSEASFNGSNIYAAISAATAEVEVTGGGKITGVNSIQLARINEEAHAELIVSGSGSQVNAETLIVAGRNATGLLTHSGGSAEVIVSDGGHIAVTNQFTVYESGVVNFEGGVIEAGSSYWNAGATYNLTLGAIANTQLDVSGNVLLRSEVDPVTSAATGVNFNLQVVDGFSGQVGDVYTIFNYGGSLTGEFLGLSEGAVISVEDTWYFELSYGSRSGDQVTLTMVPEPSSVALVISLGTLLSVFLWRRVGS